MVVVPCIVVEEGTWNVIAFVWWEIVVQPVPIPAISNYGLVTLLMLTPVAGVIVIRRVRRGDTAT